MVSSTATESSRPRITQRAKDLIYLELETWVDGKVCFVAVVKRMNIQNCSLLCLAQLKKLSDSVCCCDVSSGKANTYSTLVSVKTFLNWLILPVVYACFKD